MQAIIQPTHHTIFNKMVFEFYMFICINFYDSPHDIKLMANDSLLERRVYLQIRLAFSQYKANPNRNFECNFFKIPSKKYIYQLLKIISHGIDEIWISKAYKKSSTGILKIWIF